MINKELLRRIDERDYLTEREHREFLERLSKDLEILEILKIIVMITRNKSNGAYDGCYCLKIKPNVIPNEDTINKVKEWLNDK
jgi:hypothetical protein